MAFSAGTNVARVLPMLAFSLLLPGCRSGQPEKPLELHLKLAKNKIKAGEYLWYLLEMKNVGRKPVKIEDHSWFRQDALGENAPGYLGHTYLEIIGPDGDNAVIRRGYNPYSTNSIFGRPRFWTNDCGGGKDCKKMFGRYSDSWLHKILQGGEIWSATPSMVAPIRPRRPNVLDDPGDPRDLPEIPKGWSKAKVEALRKNWKETVEQSGYLMGDPTFRPDPKEAAVSRSRGYRVLDDCVFEKVGPYRMRVVYQFLDVSSAERMEQGLREGCDPTMQKLEAWIKGPFYALEEYLRKHGWPEETRVFRFDSNWVDFEVEAAPFPEYMFQRRGSQSAKERALTERLRREMKENFIWAEDSPQEKERKLRRDREIAGRERRRWDELHRIGSELHRGQRRLPPQETRPKKVERGLEIDGEIPLLELGRKKK